MNSGDGTGLKPRLFYRWWLVIAGFTIVACGEGAYRYLVRQLPLTLREDLGVPVGQVGLALSLPALIGFLALLAIGPVIDRFGPRWPMVAGIALAGVAFLALGLAPGLLIVFILLASLIGVGRSAGFLLPAQTAAANWFMRRRSLALAIVSAGSVAGAGLALIAGQFPERGTFLVLGAVLLAVGIPLALLMRQRPEHHGYRPDSAGGSNDASERLAEGQGVVIEEVNFTLGQAMRTRAFWLLAVAMALGQGTTATAFIYWPLLLMERGLPIGAPFIAADFVPLLGILIFGYLGDRLSKRHLLALAAVLHSLSPAALMAPGIISPVILFPTVSGLGSGTVPLLLAIRADYFGRRAFATITVATVLVTGLLRYTTALLLPLAGWLRDATGSYVPGLMLSIFVGLAAAVLFLFAQEPRSPQPVASAGSAT
jgi:MFS family permease